MAATLVMDPLDRYLEQGLASTFDWAAGRDCILWPAGWVLLATGADPASAVRGRYRSQLGAIRLMRRLGGLERVVRRGMEGVGLSVTDRPRRSDVALVDAADAADGRPVMVGAICLGRGQWAARAPKAGLVIGRASVRVAWRVR